jgi:hypothetical protein
MLYLSLLYCLFNNHLFFCDVKFTAPVGCRLHLIKVCPSKVRIPNPLHYSVNALLKFPIVKGGKVRLWRILLRSDSRDVCSEEETALAVL